MEEQKERRYQRKKLRKGRVLFTVLILALLGIGTYGVMQYRAGLQLAGEANNATPEPFVPDEKEDETVNYLLLGIDTRGEENLVQIR